MATVLSPGDLAIVQYNSSTTDSFTFVFARDIEAGTVVNFTDNGWLAAGGFRPGEGTVTYTAPTAITAGTVVTLTGLDLDAAGDQIIAYQGTQASPTILYLVDLADGNNTVAGDATNDNTTALPPGLTLGQNAVAVGFDNAIYAGPIDGSPPQLFPLISNSANWIDGNALPPSARYFYPPHLDLDSNNSTSGGPDYRAEVTNDRTPVSISDTDSDIDDPDGGIITFAQITINNPFPGDVLSVIGTLPFGIFATPFDPFTGTLFLFGFGSHSAYQTAIEQIGFSTDAPVGVTKSISVWVFDDFWWSNEAHAIFTVTSAAVPPHLDLDANNSDGGGTDYTATFTNGGLAIPVADTDVSITDPDSTTIQSARITIDINRQSGDALIAGALPPGITASSYNPFTGVLTLSGAASRAAYETALHQVVFDTTSISTADRIIRVTVNDGTLDSNVATTYMHVVLPPPNVAPVLDLDANNSTALGANYLTLFTDGGPAVAVVDADVSVIDNDSPNLASATVTLTNGDPLGSLTFNGPAPGSIFVFGSGTHQITLSGAASAADYQTALQQITYNNTGTNPSTETRVIDIVVNDGARDSNTAQALIQVEVVNNSAPVLDLDADDSSGSLQSTFRSAFTENGAPVPIADVDTSITDADSTTLVSATIKLANPETGDLLTVSGVLPGAITTAGYDPGTGVLTLTGSGTLDEYEIALKQIRYNNTSDDPVAGDRLIEVVVNDGANNSNLAVAVISVTATNDAPVMTVDPAAAYVENAAAVVLAPTAALSDLDDTELNGALVSITDGSFPGDGDILSVGGVTSNTVNGITFVWMPTQHALVFSGASSVANYQALLQQVQFQSSSDNPTDFSHSPQRTLTWAVTDSASVTTATTTINIVAVNDAPQETVAATAAYTENSSPVTISPAATASDVDNTDLIYGEVRIVAGGFDGDFLTVNGLQSGTFLGIDFSYDAGLRRLLFNNPAPVADYQALMQAVGFGSTSENPTNFGANPTRTLGWGLSDGENFSASAQTTQITITAVNDAPVNTVPGAQTVAEDSILPIVGVSVADIDSSALTTTLSVANGILNVTAGPGVSGTGTAIVTITGTAAQINAALVGLAYTGNLNFNGADTITVATSDGTATDTDLIAITVNAVNDPPINTVPAAQSVAEDTILPIAGVSVADIDSSALTTTLNVSSGTLTVIPGAGVTGNGTASVTIAGTAAQINAALAGLAYTGNLDFNGADTLTVATSDGTATDTDLIAITVNPVNDAPINTVPGAQSVAEDTALPIAGVSVADIDSSALTTTLSVAHGILNVTPGAGVTGNGSAIVTIAGTAAEINAALAGLGYIGNLDFNGADTLTVATSDGTAIDTDTIAITVNAVNDAPVNTVPGAQSVAEDTALPITGVSVADVDGDALTTTLNVSSGTLNVIAGGGVTGNGTASVTITGTAAQINAALTGLTYTGNPNFNSGDTLTVATSDGTATDTDLIAITVNPVNDAPVNTVPGAQSVAEDTALPIAGVSVADIDSSTLTTTLNVSSGTLNVAAGGGGVTGNGSAIVIITGTAAQINTALAGLAYTGNPNFNGGDTLTVATSDGTAIDTDTVAITVNPVNDAPVNTVPGAQSVDEDTALPIAGVSVADIDSSALTTTLNVSSGILNVTAGGGAGVSGNGSASVTITGTAVQINTALAGLAYTGNLDFNGVDTLTVATSDGTATDTDTVAITVIPVNDAPVNTVPGAQSVAEDTALPIAGVSVAEIDSSALTTTLSVSSGILNVTAGAGVSGNGTASVTITGTAAQINTALAGLTYTGNLNFNGGDTLTVATSDGTATDTDLIAITVNPVNDTPALDLDANNSTTPDANYLTGFTDGGPAVEIVDTDVLITDDDTELTSATVTLTNHDTDDVLVAGALPPGITASAYDSATGILTLTGTASLAAYQTALQQITFDNTGTTPSTATRVIDIVVNDGASNSNTAKAFIQVEVVNNSAPVLDLDPNDSGGSARTTFRTAFTENGDPVPIADVDTSITDSDSTELVSATITLTNPQTGDLLTVSGALPGAIATVGYDPGTGVLTLTGVGTLAEYETALKQIFYSSTSNDPGTEDRLIEVVVNDGANNSNVAAALISVTATNDAPVITVDPSAAYVENAAAVVLAPSATLSDVDDTELNFAAVHITAGSFPGDGDTLTVNGDTSGTTVTGITFLWNPTLHTLVLTGASSVANYQAVLQTVQFQSTSHNPTDFNASPQRTLTWSVSDGTTITTATTTLDITAVNDPPINTVPGAQSVAEDTILPIAGVSVADSDSSALTTTLSVSSGTLTVTAGTGVTGNGTASVTITGTAAQINAALTGLAYTGNLDFNGGDTLTVATNDGTATDTDLIAITVNPVNDAPINTVPGAQSVAEDTALPIAGVSVADSDSSALTTTLNVSSGILNVTAGTGVTGNGTASVTITGTAAQINAALAGLTYTGNLNFNGGDTLTVATNDGTATDTDLIAITVTPVNDAPVNTVPAAQSVDEDTILPIAGVSVADIDSSALTTTLNVSSGTLTVTAGAGVTGNGTASVTITGTAVQINAALVGLAYTGNPDFNGGDTLTVATSDGTATDTDLIAITVNPVNDAPVNTVPGAQSVAEDTILPIAGVSVADIDSSALTTTLSVLSGTLNVIAGAGVTGNGSASVSIAGTAAQINAALAGLTYTGNPDFNGGDTLTVVSSDGTATDTDLIAITVNPVNDAPVNTVPGAQSVAEDTALPIAGVSVADIDSSALTTTLSVSSGILNVTAGAGVSGNGSASVSIAGTAAQINAALAGLTYTGNPDFNGADTLTVVSSDGTATDTDLIAITVNPVNDPPVLAVADATYQEDVPVLLSPSASLTDADDTVLDFAAVQITAGSFSGDGDTLTVNGDTSGTTVTGITFLWDPTLHALVFTGVSLVANYQAVLQTVQFQSTSHNPTDSDASPERTLTWFVSDGTAVTTAETTLDIVAHDDVAVAEPDAVPTTESSVIRARALAGSVFVDNGSGPDSDPDGGTFEVTAVSAGTVGARITLPSGALLIVNANGTFDYDPNHKFDYLPTPDSGASNLTVTDTFSYTITGGDTATVTVTVHGVDTDDVLYDSGDTDNLAGGIGNDVYYVSNTGDVVTEAANAGSDTVAAFVNYTLPANNTVEVLNMIGAGLTGTGTDGAETFISSSGPNTLIGLGGNDTYYVNHADDDVIEAPDGGVDTVLASVDYTMPADAEGLYMMGSGLTGMGTNNADSLLSSGGPNTLVGLDGDDLYYVNNAADVVVEVPNEGFDSVITSLSYDLSANAANVEALYLTGSGLTGTGNSDANTLVNAGANTLTGGDGNDTFVFSAGSANGATVTDFNRDQVTEWDFLVFSGFGTQGATFSQIGTTDQWQIHSGLDGHNETITLSNHAVVHAGDFVFV